MPKPEPPTLRERAAAARPHIDRTIVIKVRIYLTVFVIVLAAAVIDAARGTGLTWIFLGAGVIVGTAIGILASRMQRFDWNDFEKRAVGRFDLVGVIVLIAYLVFAINRSRIVDAWVPAEHAPATSLAVLASVMFGQVLGIRHGLHNLGRRLGGASTPE